MACSDEDAIALPQSQYHNDAATEAKSHLGGSRQRMLASFRLDVSHENGSVIGATLRTCPHQFLPIGNDVTFGGRSEE